jgi:hypothetical protein
MYSERAVINAMHRLVEDVGIITRRHQCLRVPPAEEGQGQAADGALWSARLHLGAALGPLRVARRLIVAQPHHVGG